MFGVQKKTAAHWRLPKKNVFRPQEKLIFCVMWNATKFSRTSLNCGNALGFERWSGGHCQQPKTKPNKANGGLASDLPQPNPRVNKIK